MSKWLFPAFACLVLIHPAAYAAPQTIDRLEASVNAALILLSDVAEFRKTEKLRVQLDPLFQNTDLAKKGENATPSEIVSFLIDEKLIAQQFPTNDGEVEQQISSIQSTNHIDRPQLKAALTEQGFSFDEYFELIRISASKRDLIDRDIRTKVTISDDDVKNYFYNHYARTSNIPLAYHLQVVSVSTKNYKTPSAAREVAERAAQDSKAGEAFTEIAKRVSDDPSASAGGDLGTLTADQLSPQILDQVKKLTIGQTSGVFGSISLGAFYVVHLVDIQSSDSERYEKMKEEIRSQLAAGEYQHQISLWLERQKQAAFIHRAGEPAVAGLAVTPSGR